MYICPSVMYPVRSGVGCVISDDHKFDNNKKRNKSRTTIKNLLRKELERWRTIIGHGQNWNLGDGPLSAFNTSCTLIYCSQIGIHITRISTPTRYFFSSSRDLKLQLILLTSLYGKRRRRRENVQLPLEGHQHRNSYPLRSQEHVSHIHMLNILLWSEQYEE